MFICKNGAEHRHTTAEEARICWGLLPQPVPATVPVSGPVRPYEHTEPATASQLRYVQILGGDLTRATSMSKRDCSAYIDRLKSGKEKPVTTPPPTAAIRDYGNSPRKVPVELLKMVREGRYAVRPDSDTPWTFIRISIGKGRSRWKDCIKVQTKHGPNLSEPKLIVYPSGQAQILRGQYDIEDALLLIIADQQGAARNYAKVLGECARCGLDLTDPESRRIGVGPECVKHWPHMVELADLDPDFS